MSDITSKLELARITDILFPKNNISNQKESNQVNIKTQMDKLKKQVNVILQKHQRLKKQNIQLTERTYLEKIKLLSSNLSNYPQQILQASQSLIDAIPNHHPSQKLSEYYKMSAVLKVMQFSLMKIYNRVKIDAFSELSLIVSSYQIKKQTKHLKINHFILKIMKSKFKQWRFNAQFLKDQEIIKQIQSDWNINILEKTIQNLTNQSKLVYMLQLSDFKQQNVVEILLYNSQTNTLRSYIQSSDLQISGVQTISQLQSLRSMRSLKDQQIKRYEFSLEKSLTQICLKSGQIQVIHNITEKPYYSKIDSPCFTNFNSNSNRRITFQGGVFYPLINNGKAIGLIRQYFYSKPVVHISQQKLKYYAHIFSLSINLTSKMRQYWSQRCKLVNNYYLRIVKIIKHLQNIKQSKQIYSQLQKQIQSIIPNISLQVYKISKINTSQNKYVLKILYQSVNEQINSKHLIPAVQTITNNNINYIICSNDIVFITSNQILFNITISQFNEDLFNLIELLHKLFQKTEEILNKKIYDEQMVEMFQRQQLQGLKIRKQNQLRQKMTKNIIRLYEGNTDQNLCQRMYNFIQDILEIKQKIIIMITIKSHSASYIYKNNSHQKQGITYFQYIERGEIHTLYENQFILIRLKYEQSCILEKQIIKVLQNYIQLQIMNFQSTNHQKYVEKLKLSYLKHSDHKNLENKFIKIISQSFNVQSIVRQSQNLPTLQWINYPQTYQTIISKFIGKENTIQFKKISQININYELKKIIKQNQFNNQFTIVTINQQTLIIINKSIQFNQCIFQQLKSIYNCIRKQLYQHQQQCFKVKLNQWLLKIAEKSNIKFLKMKQQAFNLIKKKQKLKKYPQNIFNTIKRIINSRLSIFLNKCINKANQKKIYCIQVKKMVMCINNILTKNSFTKLLFKYSKKAQFQNKSLKKIIKYVQKLQNQLKQLFFIKALNFYLVRKSYPFLNLIKFGISIKSQFMKKLILYTSHQRNKQSNISYICNSKTYKQLFQRLSSSYQNYVLCMRVPSNEYLTSSMSLISPEQIKKKQETFGKYQFLSKGQLLIWFIKKDLQLSLANKNQLTNLSKGIVQFKRKFLSISKGCIKLLIKNYKKNIYQLVKSNFIKWRQNILQQNKFESYRYKELIYHMKIQQEAIIEKIKLRTQENQQYQNQLKKLQKKQGQNIKNIQAINLKIKQINFSSQQLSSLINIQNSINQKNRLKLAFQKWRVVNTYQNMIVIQKRKKKMLLTSFNFLNKIFFHLLQKKVGFCFKILAINYVHARNFSKCNKLLPNSQEDINIGVNVGRLMTFQEDNQLNKTHLSEYCDYNNINIEKQNQYDKRCFKQLKMNEEPSISICDVTDDQINRVNSVGYKLNVKTIKFLKRMGKINNI